MKHIPTHALAVVRKFYPNIESVVDATEPLNIEVTKRDNQNSAVKNHKKCALAVACERKKDVDGVIISIATAYLIKGNQAIRYKVPPSVSREIVSFDRKAGFEEGFYKLNAPTVHDRLGYSTTPRNHAETGRGRKIKRRHVTENVREHLTT
jgi:hypothetical protein